MLVRKEDESKPQEVNIEGISNQVEATEATTKELVSPIKNMSATAFLDKAESEGFEGLDLTKNSFNSVVLDSGVFVDAETKEDLKVTDEDGIEHDFSKSLVINLISSRVKHMINISEPGAGKEDEGELHVVYGEEEKNHRGESMVSILALAEEDGCDVNKSTYLELVGAVLLEPKAGEEIDTDNILDVISISVPPMSKNRVSGSITVYNSRHRKDPITSPSQAILKCTIGISSVLVKALSKISI